MMEVEENNAAEENKMSSSSSESDDSSSSDSDEEFQVEEKLRERLKELNELLGSDPSKAYEFYLEKIAIYKKLGDLGQLRTVRENMSKLYPLSPAIWLEWIQDEINLVSNAEEKKNVIQLFERAVEDYLSVDIWIAYIQFVMKDICGDGGVDMIRETFEKALISCALHVGMGSLIWDTYRDFEAGLFGMDKSPEQKERYESVCRRQLAIPLVGMEKAYDTIKESDVKLSDAVEENYKEALEKLKNIMPYETKLTDSTEYADKLEAYRSYIAEEKKQKSKPPTIICLYERALCDYPLESWLWLEYLEYVSRELKLEQLVYSIAEKAIRNCPWYLPIWTKYMTEIEKYSSDKDKIKDIFERGLSFCPTGEIAGSLWLKYLEFLQRRANSSSDEASYDLLLKTLQAAEEHLTTTLFDPNAYIAEVLLFDLRVRVHKHKSLEKGREVWMKLLGRGYGHQFKVWLEYYHLELKYGDLKSNRKCLEKGMNSVEDHLDIVSSLWLNFERAFGDLLTQTKCEKSISNRLERVQKKLAETTFETHGKKPKPRKRKKSGQESGKDGIDEAAECDGDESIPGKKPKSNNTREHANHPRDRKQFQSHRGFKPFNKPFNKPRFTPREPEPEIPLVRRPQKSFVPRSLQVRHEEPNPPSTTTTDNTKPTKPMSNDDFRNLFKKKPPSPTTASEKE